MDDAKVQILLVEDNPGDAILLQETLRVTGDCYQFVWAQTLAAANEQVRTQNFDIVLLDLGLPDATRLQGLKQMQTISDVLPIVVLTGMADIDLGISAMREGAQDYLVKGQLDGRLLERCIRYAIERQRVQVDLRNVAKQLRQSQEELEARVAHRTADLAHTVNVLHAEVQARRQAELELRDSENRRHAVVQGVPMILWAMDNKGTVTFAEGKGLNLLGLTPELVVGQSILAMGDFDDQAIPTLQRAVSGEAGSVIFSAGGMKFDTRYTPVLGPKGKVTGIIGVSTDVTERMQTQAQLHRANRALRVLSECSQAMMRASSPRDLLRQTCRTIIKIGGYQLAWVVSAGQSGKQAKLLAQSGLGPQFAQDPEWLKRHESISLRAITDGRPAVIRPVPDHADSVEGGPLAECRSVIALPLEVEPNIKGAMIICSSDHEAFDSEEVNLLTELASEISFGLAGQQARLDRQQAQNALVEQAQIVDAFFEHTATPLAVLDRRLRFLRVNPAYSQAFSQEIDFLKGRNLADFFPLSIQKMFRKVLRSRRSVLDHAHCATFEGRPDWGVTYWDVAIVPVLTPEGKVDSLVLSLHDVTQRKRQEKQILATNMLLETFAHKATRKEYLQGVLGLIKQWSSCRCTGIRMVDNERRVPYTSTIGFTKSFLNSENDLSIAKDDCVCLRVISGKHLDHDSKCMTQRGSFACHDAGEYMKTLDARQRATFRGTCVQAGYKTLVLIPIRYRNQVLGAIQIADPRASALAPEVLDSLELLSPLIGEAFQRFAIEEALKVSEEHFRSMIESSSDCIAHVSLDGRYMSINQVGCELNGFSRAKDLLGTKVTTGIIANVEGLELALQLACKGETASIQYTSLDSKRNEIWWDCRLTPVIDESGQTTSILMVARDDTEHRRLEREIVEIATNERLRIGQDLHDSLGQHLTGITFLCKSLQQRLASKGITEATNAGELSELVNRAINQTRMLARGLCPVEPKAEGLISALRELAESIDSTYKISCLLTYDRTFVLHDDYKALQIYHIVQECLTNAAKHSKASRVVVSIERCDGTILVTVSDDGIGIGRTRDGNGMGLRTMRYRAGMIGASLEVKRTGRRGTKVVCTVIDRGPAAQPVKSV